MTEGISYLLLQIRNPEDPIRHREVHDFCYVLGCPAERVTPWDLVSGAPPAAVVDGHDMVLIGGSGDYSVVRGGDWLPPALDFMRELHTRAKPTFASCWGFQALSLALGGEVVTDLTRAEIGTPLLSLTKAGREDPVFGILGDSFRASMGHQDIVDRIPADAVLLASSSKVVHEAYRIADKPIYCTQFHPELTVDGLLQRLAVYPEYVAKIAGIPIDLFLSTCVETPETNRLLRRMVEVVFGD